MQQKLNNSCNTKFDIDLKEAEIFEQKIKDVFENKKIEVKTEKDIWRRTKNICIEIKYKGNKSGINKTESDYWFQVFQKDGNIKFIIAFPVTELRQLVCDHIGDNTCEVKKGGDNLDSDIVLIPLNKLFEPFLENNQC